MMARMTLAGSSGMGVIREWFRRWCCRLLHRDAYLELHILEFAAQMEEGRTAGRAPDLKGYSRAEIDAKTRELFDRVMIRGRWV